MDRLYISPSKHKYIKQKAIKLKFLTESFALLMTCLEKQLYDIYLFV